MRNKLVIDFVAEQRTQLQIKLMDLFKKHNYANRTDMDLIHDARMFYNVLETWEYPNYNELIVAIKMYTDRYDGNLVVTETWQGGWGTIDIYSGNPLVIRITWNNNYGSLTYEWKGK